VSKTTPRPPRDAAELPAIPLLLAEVLLGGGIKASPLDFGSLDWSWRYSPGLIRAVVCWCAALAVCFAARLARGSGRQRSAVFKALSLLPWKVYGAFVVGVFENWSHNRTRKARISIFGSD
jgi:hypothetical protein